LEPNGFCKVEDEMNGIDNPIVIPKDRV